MNYVALLRGINVGVAKRVEMKRLKAVLLAHGFSDVATYINSGNAFFSSSKKSRVTSEAVEKILEKEFGFPIPTIVKTQKEMQTIARAIPKKWQNNTDQKTDIAYLFPTFDSKKIIDELPIQKEYVDIRYVKGAVMWNVLRKNYNKSRLNKLVGHKIYKGMTLRNVNTARFLAQKMPTLPLDKRKLK